MPDAANHPGRRETDHTRRAKVLAFWRDWGSLVVGVGLILVSLVVLKVALEQRDDDRRTEAAARASCERTKEFGVPIADFFEREGVLTTEQLAAYRRSIPKQCP